MTLKEERNTIKKEIEENERLLQVVIKKTEDLKNLSVKIESDLTNAEKKRKSLLEAFALEKATQSEVDSIRSECNRLVQKKAETKELIEATAKAIETTRREIPVLHQKLATVEHELWSVVYNNMKREIQKLLGDLPLKAFAAKTLTNFYSFDTLCRDLLFNDSQPGIEEGNAMREKLKEKYY